MIWEPEALDKLNSLKEISCWTKIGRPKDNISNLNSFEVCEGLDDGFCCSFIIDNLPSGYAFEVNLDYNGVVSFYILQPWHLIKRSSLEEFLEILPTNIAIKFLFNLDLF